MATITNYDCCCDGGAIGPTGPPGIVASSRFNIPLTGPQTITPSINPVYISFDDSGTPQGLYDYDDNNAYYSINTGGTGISIGVTGYYNVGINMACLGTGTGQTVFQIQNLLIGAIGTVPPIATSFIQIVPLTVFSVPDYTSVGVGSTSANCLLNSGSTVAVVATTDVQYDISPTSCLNISLLHHI